MDARSVEVMYIPPYHRWLAIAHRIHKDAEKFGFGWPQVRSYVEARECSLLDRFDKIVTISTIGNACRELFADGHYSDSVLKACTVLCNAVKDKACLREQDKDGSNLMRYVFSLQNPKLKINSLETQSNKSEQQGYMEIYAGVMTAIRNPRAHEHDIRDDPEVALELLSLINHLMRKLDVASKT